MMKPMVLNYRNKTVKIRVGKRVGNGDLIKAGSRDYLQSVVIPYGVETIGPYFCRDSPILSGINIPETVTQIEEYAFYNCRYLDTIIGGKNVKHVEHGAFTNRDDVDHHKRFEMNFPTVEVISSRLTPSILLDAPKLKALEWDAKCLFLNNAPPRLWDGWTLAKTANFKSSDSYSNLGYRSVYPLPKDIAIKELRKAMNGRARIVSLDFSNEISCIFADKTQIAVSNNGVVDYSLRFDLSQIAYKEFNAQLKFCDEYTPITHELIATWIYGYTIYKN